MNFIPAETGLRRLTLLAAAVMAASAGVATASAHGFVGDRFFPPTIQTDDPFATDELLLPSISTVENPGSPTTHVTDIGFEFDKEIFPRFALGISGDLLHETIAGHSAVTGLDDFALSAKYQLWENPAHEAIISIGAIWEMGGTGSKKVGADPANTFTPTLYFGKGFGDLPDSVSLLKPVALTGTLGEDLPTEGEPNNLAWGLAVEYSLPYLQTEVKDVGLPHPLRDLIPLVEFAFSTPENRGGGPTTGTINPGVLYENPYCQIGVEAVIPVNSASGKGVGAILQIQIFIDDIFPKTFGHPLWGQE